MFMGLQDFFWNFHPRRYVQKDLFGQEAKIEKFLQNLFCCKKQRSPRLSRFKLIDDLFF